MTVSREELIAMLRYVEYCPTGDVNENCPLCDASERSKTHEAGCELGNLLARLKEE